MALGITKTIDYDAPSGSALRDLIIQYNATAAWIRVLCLKLDADGTVTDTNYTDLLDAAVSKIGNAAGTTITV